MSSPIHACIHCGSEKIFPLGKTYAHAFLHRCSSCDLVFTAQKPDHEELIVHYKQYNRGIPISPITVKRYEELLGIFEKYRKTNNILDVGCGDGHFLEVAKKKGWNVSGTEYDPVACDVCREKGIKIFNGKITAMESGKKFDIITSFEVLEHIQDGKDDVKFIRELLRDDGVFYFTTPNFNSCSRKWLKGKWTVIGYPEHLTYYTPFTIHDLLLHSGLEKIFLRTSGVSVQRFAASKQGDENNIPKDEDLRKQIEEKFFLRVLKKTVNGILNNTGTGDTIKGLYTRK